jgi:HK97 family phage major capsid protein
MDSVLKAAGRLAEDFVTPDTLVVHPRDMVKFALATDSTGRYIFENGLAGALGGTGIDVVVDANVPDDLGTGTDETVAILGNFTQGAWFFSRTPLVVAASRDAGWVTDETVYRAVERFGFAVTVPAAFEVLSGIEQ